MSHVTKILLKIILYRNSAAINREICENQSGFRNGKGTQERIFNLRTIIERYLEKQKDVYICFIDYEKASDRVNYEKLIEKLKLAGMDGKDVRARLYECEPTKGTQKVSKSVGARGRHVCYHHTF